jgi:spermidine synthase
MSNTLSGANELEVSGKRYITYTKNEGNFIKITDFLINEKSEFQDIKIAESPLFGRILFLDNILQITEYDEAIYHEMMVHPAAACSGGKLKRALILGGGDGCALREILKYPDIEEAVMVDIDSKVINVCKKHFSDINKSSFDSDKARIKIGDAAEYVKSAKPESFDLLVMDLIDATGPGRYFGSVEFLRMCKKLIRKEGVLVTHGNFASDYPYSCRLYRNLKKIFRYIGMNVTHMPSFGQGWAFIAASDWHDPKDVPQENINKKTRGMQFRHYIPGISNSYMRLSPIKQDIVENFDEENYSDSQKKEITVFGRLIIEK